MPEDQVFIQRCLELAQRGRGQTAPNPMVGAVLVYQGKIIGEGWHKQHGKAHAEVNCLDSVGQEDRHLIPESTMYVSLEPCAHEGKTPSCALRLVKEKVKEVVVCNTDPFELVKGKGLDILSDNGIPTRVGVLEDPGQWVNRRFFCFHQQSRPYIILKWAETQRGFFAPLDKTRHQMSNKHSQQLVHKWRTEEAAILVGTETALMDNPQLTARLWKGKQPLRIVLDRTLKLPPTLRAYQHEAPTWVINGVMNEHKGHLRYLKLNFDEGLLPELTKELHKQNILSLIVEGGATLLNSFIEQGLWDEARVFVTPDILQDGLQSPSLPHSVKAFTTTIDSDLLHVYVNNQSCYPYINGMEL